MENSALPGTQASAAEFAAVSESLSFLDLDIVLDD